MIKFLSNSVTAFGLDLSASSVKLMQLEKKDKRLSLKAYSSALLPKGLVVNDIIGDAKIFSALLKQSLDKPDFGKFTTDYVVASLPESKSFVRVIQLPAMSSGEAESAVPYEAESFIPMPLDQVYLDWQKIGETGDKMNILIIASPKDFVDGYLEVLDKSGLRSAALEVESQSCVRAALPAGEGLPEAVLLVDLGSVHSSLIMVEDGNLQFTSTIPIAGGTFTESLAKALGISSAKAEEIKRKVGVANTTEYPNIQIGMLPVLNNLEAEIKNILKFHSEHSGRQVRRIVLTGGSAKLKNLPDFLLPLLQEVGIAKVELANPWQVSGLQKTAAFNDEDSLNFAAVMGLAMRGADYKII